MAQPECYEIPTEPIATNAPPVRSRPDVVILLILTVHIGQSSAHGKSVVTFIRTDHQHFFGKLVKKTE